MSTKPLTMLVPVLVLTASTVLGLSVPAQAAARDGKCDGKEFCYYYNSNNAGSVSDFTGSLDNYGTSQPSCYDFKGAGNGRTKCIKNQAASMWNRTSKTVRVYFNSNYGGVYQEFAPGAKGNLNAKLKNQNASHRFFNTSSVPAPPQEPAGLLAPDKGTQVSAALTKWVIQGKCAWNEVIHDDILTGGVEMIQPWTGSRTWQQGDGLTTYSQYRTGVTQRRVMTFCTNNTPSGEHLKYTVESPMAYAHQTLYQTYERRDAGVAVKSSILSSWQPGFKPANW